MLARDIEMFIEHCGLKGLSTKTINSYEQTLRLFMQYMDEQGILQTEKITHLAIFLQRRITMEKKNDKKFNWKKAAVIGGIFAAGVAVGVAGDKVYIKMMFKKHYQDILKDYRLRVDTGTTIKGVKKVIISITDKTTGKTFGTTWLPETAKEIGETILQYAEEGMANG